MQPCTIQVRAPSRLHFGLFSFGAEGRQYGGVGVMLDAPSLQLEVSSAQRFEAVGEMRDILTQGVRKWARFRRQADLPHCRIALSRMLPRHVGLGSGTQLMLALVAGLQAFTGHPPLTPQQLAVASGRGRRSAVGTYGFLSGGLIVESGKLAGELLAPLEQRLDFPLAWRFVLVQAGDRDGLHGNDERHAFEELPPVANQTRQELINEVHSNLLPALLRCDCAAFGESLYRFGRRAGSCFAKLQGGPYNGPRLTSLVREIRALGVPGVAQSSWGPTLFCILPDQASADALRDTLVRDQGIATQEICVTRANNHGAEITVN